MQSLSITEKVIGDTHPDGDFELSPSSSCHLKRGLLHHCTTTAGDGGDEGYRQIICTHCSGVIGQDLSGRSKNCLKCAKEAAGGRMQ